MCIYRYGLERRVRSEREEEEGIRKEKEQWARGEMKREVRRGKEKEGERRDLKEFSSR